MICTQKIFKQFAKIQLLSAKSLLRIGQYDQCLLDPLMNYNMINLASKNDTSHPSGYIGLCLPNQCTSSTIKTIINYFFNKNPQIPLLVSSVQSNFQDNFPYQWIFYLTIIIILVIFSLVLMGTWLKIKPQKNYLVSNFNMKESLKIFEKRQSSLNVFNGVKALSMLWVIFGHSYQLAITLNSNQFTLQAQYNKWPILIVTGGLFAVDVFFFLGGFLFAYSIMKQKVKNRGLYFLAIIHRALRFWPCYFLTIIFFYSVLIHLNTGPLWSYMYQSTKGCSTIWRPLLFVDNLVQNGKNQCLGWGWYLQNDMQIFIMLVFVTYIMSLNKIAGKIFGLFLMLGASIYFFIGIQIHNVKIPYHIIDYQTFSDGDFNEQLDLYIKPWARAGPYVLGYFLGIAYLDFLQNQKHIHRANRSILLKCKRIFQRRRLIRILTQIFGLSIMIFLVFIGRILQVHGTDYWPQIIHSLYLSNAKMLFVIGLTFLLLPSLLGIKESLIRSTLDTKFFNFIAKISFCTYLVHLMIIMWYAIGRNFDYYYTFESTIVNASFYIATSLFFGFWMTVMVQVPFSKLEKDLLGNIKGKVKKKSNKRQNHQQVLLQQNRLSFNQSQNKCLNQINEEEK